VVFEIVILAMIAAFLGMRLYSVLGRRAEHEEELASRPIERVEPSAAPAPREPDAAPAAGRMAALPDLPGLAPGAQNGVRAIASADRTFDVVAFLGGARAAYGMVLEAFWEGDKALLRDLCDDDVYASFAAAIDAREKAGETLDNRLVRIEEATLTSAELDGRTARIAVRFAADIAAVTRNADGEMIAGSLDDAIEANDVWTFERRIDAYSPDWVLTETDEG
jgi:predicted lipid-binding transport protein (Tim44 family)